jgi:hypothetical protein
MSAGKIVKSDEVRNGLISLIDRKKSAFHGGISEIVKREFDLISEARKIGASWTEIVETLGFLGKEDGFSLAFWRERKRREKKGSPVPTSSEVQAAQMIKQEQKTENRKISEDAEARRAALRESIELRSRERAREKALAGPAHETGAFVLKPDTSI